MNYVTGLKLSLAVALLSGLTTASLRADDDSAKPAPTVFSTVKTAGVLSAKLVGIYLYLTHVYPHLIKKVEDPKDINLAYLIDKVGTVAGAAFIFDDVKELFKSVKALVEQQVDPVINSIGQALVSETSSNN